MSRREKRTINEILPLPSCLQFLENRRKLGDCFYYAIREESLAQLCLIEGAIQTHKILILREDTLNARWFLFSSLYKRSLVVSNEEIKLYSKFFDILLQNNKSSLNNIRDSILEVVWFLDEEILKCRLMQILKICVLPLLSFSDCHYWIQCFEKEKKLILRVKEELDMNENEFDDVTNLFRFKITIEYIYLLEKKLRYVCPSIVIMFSQLYN